MAATITETEPTSIVNDFGIFVTYIKENNPSLVRNGHFLMKKTLSEINDLVNTPNPPPLLETSTYLYPYFTLFYALAQRSNLFIKTADLHLKGTERLTGYNQLTPPEKYFFLLETLWIDTDWSFILFDRYNSFLIPNIQSVIKYLAEEPPGKIIPMDQLETNCELLDAHYFLEYMSLFGLLHITRKEIPEESPLIVSAAVTALGGLVFPVLYRERQLHCWNIPYMREKTEEFVVFPESKEHEPFFKPFQHIVPLQKTVPRTYTKGTFTVKVSLRKGLERTIVLSSEHTLQELHEAIQDAFAFDSDHLYAFFTDGIPWSCHRILAPEDETGPFADQISIGDLGLVPGQWMLYIFDFGSEWQFKIEILDITSDVGPPSPVVTAKKGKSPEQYLSWD
jgi:shikimate kinase